MRTRKVKGQRRFLDGRDADGGKEEKEEQQREERESEAGIAGKREREVDCEGKWKW